VPTRKQRRRAQKERRHEYETVWVDEEGNELDEPPDDYVEQAPREKRADGKPKPKSQPRTGQRGGRQMRAPLPPSWRRAARRSLILGGVIFVLFYLLNSKSGSSHRLESALLLAVLYTGLFVPFTYYIDRFSYKRWERRESSKR